MLKRNCPSRAEFICKKMNNFIKRLCRHPTFTYGPGISSVPVRINTSNIAKEIGDVIDTGRYQTPYLIEVVLTIY